MSHTSISPFKMRRNAPASTLAKRPRFARASKKKSPGSKIRGMVTVPRSVNTFGGGPFPNKYRCSLSYSELVTVTVTTGHGEQLFACNGLFDPNTTGTGHQPLYFDQLMAIYDHYTVINSSCKATICDGSATAWTTTMFLDDDATTGTTTAGNLPLERPGCVSMISVPLAETKSLRKSWSSTATFGSNPMDDTTMQGSSTQNPSELTHFVTHFFDPLLASHTLLVRFDLRFDTIFDELVSMGLS